MTLDSDERYLVTDPGFMCGVCRGIPDHFRAEVGREEAPLPPDRLSAIAGRTPSDVNTLLRKSCSIRPLAVMYAGGNNYMKVWHGERKWYTKAMQGTANFLDKLFVKHLLIPILHIVPVWFLLALMRAKGGASTNGTPTNGAPTYFLDAVDYIQSNTIFVSLCVALYLVVLHFLTTAPSKLSRPQGGVDIKGAMTLFQSLEHIVSGKAERFVQCANRACEPDSKISPDAVFMEITQPDQQIALLIQGIYTFFQALDTDDDVEFTVSVVAIENGEIQDWFYFWPHSAPPQTPIEELRQPDSTASHCLNSGRMVVIEDVDKEAQKGHSRRFRPNPGEEPSKWDGGGSLVCYPVRHNKTIPYVITIYADKKRYFLNKKKDLYKWVFRHFQVRMSLEHSLLILRNKVSSDDQDRVV